MNVRSIRNDKSAGYLVDNQRFMVLEAGVEPARPLLATGF